MTCIVGIIEGEKVYLGGDSAGVSGLDIRIRKDPKVFKVSEFVIGFTSSFRMGQLLMHSFTPPTITGDLYKYMINEFIPEVRKCFKDGGYIETSNGADVGGLFLVGIRGRLFTIDSDFQVGETHDNIMAVGCGASYALGALYASDEKDPKKRVKKALKAAEYYSGGVRAPFTIESV